MAKSFTANLNPDLLTSYLGNVTIRKDHVKLGYLVKGGYHYSLQLDKTLAKAIDESQKGVYCIVSFQVYPYGRVAVARQYKRK